MSTIITISGSHAMNPPEADGAASVFSADASVLAALSAASSSRGLCFGGFVSHGIIV